MSKIGVPSSMSSADAKDRTAPPDISTIVNPIGFGRLGDRVANTPCGRSSVGGVTVRSNPSERWNVQMTIR